MRQDYVCCLCKCVCMCGSWSWYWYRSFQCDHLDLTIINYRNKTVMKEGYSNYFVNEISKRWRRLNQQEAFSSLILPSSFELKLHIYIGDWSWNLRFWSSYSDKLSNNQIWYCALSTHTHKHTWLWANRRTSYIIIIIYYVLFIPFPAI